MIFFWSNWPGAFAKSWNSIWKILDPPLQPYAKWLLRKKSCEIKVMAKGIGTKFTWIVVINIFATDLLLQPFLGCHLYFTTFFLLARATPFLNSLVVFDIFLQINLSFFCAAGRVNQGNVEILYCIQIQCIKLTIYTIFCKLFLEHP